MPWFFFGPQERITISGPASAALLTSPVTVSGKGIAAFENTLGVRVRDQAGSVIGSGSAIISGALGARGRFSVSVTYTLAGAAQAGRVEVYDTSARDGNVTHLASVEVRVS